MARTLLETYALTAAMTAPTHDFGTGLFDTSQEMEHLELTLAAGLGVNRNGDRFPEVRLDRLGLPSVWYPMQVSRVSTPPSSPPSPIWEDQRMGLRLRRYSPTFPNPFIDQLRTVPLHPSRPLRLQERIGTPILNPRGVTRPVSAPSGGPVATRMYMDRQTWDDIVHFGGGQAEEFRVPAVRSAVEQRAFIAAQEVQRAREDQHVFDILDNIANSPVLDIDPTRPEPMRLRIPTFEIGRDTPLSPEELARLPAGAPVSLQERVSLERYHEQLRTEATQAVDEDIFRTLTPHVPLDMVQMTGRFPMSMIPLDHGPTIRLDEIRTRRFNILGREPVTVPPIPPPKPMTLEQMEKVALVCRRTFWEKLLDDEYAY